MLALVAAGFIWLAASKAEDSKRLSVALSLMVVLQLLLGMLNVALQAPVWLQLTHLLLADTMWVALVWLGFRQPEVQSDAVEQPHRNASQALSP